MPIFNIGKKKGLGGNNTLQGTEGEDWIYGYGGEDTLIGLGGTDYLDGGLGADTMIGGLGDDHYWVDNAGDVVIEAKGEGVDTVYTTLNNYTLPAHVENLRYDFFTSANLTGNGLNNRISGNMSGDTLSGGGGNDYLKGEGGADTMIGGTGGDFYDVETAGDVVVEAAGEGIDKVFFYGNFNYALSANVEKLEIMDAAGAVAGIGNHLDNEIVGNGSVNTLMGWGGNDTLDGKGGADTMIGGAGDDEYYVDTAGDMVVEAPGDGIDKVFLSGAFDYALGTNVENLEILDSAGAVDGTGNGWDNRIVGNGDVNTLVGGGGGDTLDGKGGADTMIGGAGDDEYYVDTAGDVVVEAADEGVDKVFFSGTVGYALGANVENLDLMYADGAVFGTGNDLDNTIWGNDDANTLTGGGGDDTFRGRDGADTMIGGTGDDNYYVFDAGDVVTELADEGNDWVLSNIDHTLTAHVERLTLLNGGAINGTGNGLDNIIWGNNNANILDGGAGADIMYGGEGSDQYWVDNIGDQTIDTGLPDVDWVFASAHHIIGTGIEKLTLVEGAGELYGWGNGLDNEIFGNNSGNVIDGQGGSDTVWGAGGNDWLVFAQGGLSDTDVDHLDGGADNDTVTFSMYDAAVYVDLDYGAPIDVYTNKTANAWGFETWTGIAGLDNIENVVGTIYNDRLIGDAAANRIEGGFGNDVLTGEGGMDAFVFRSFSFDGSHVDQITDFSVTDDTIYLDNAGFDALIGSGVLAAGAFHVGATAADADDYIIYNSATGGLFYDPDANGAGAACQFAQLSAGLTLTNQDFLVL